MYSGVKKNLPPAFFFIFGHNRMIQIIKQIWILLKDNPSKYKIQFWHTDFIY